VCCIGVVWCGVVHIEQKKKSNKQIKNQIKKKETYSRAFFRAESLFDQPTGV
jgi:hypothetical protein